MDDIPQKLRALKNSRFSADVARHLRRVCREFGQLRGEELSDPEFYVWVDGFVRYPFMLSIQLTQEIDELHRTLPARFGLAVRPRKCECQSC